ncbi:hypothetical protein FF1_031650 [Malus domestica]
MLNSGISPDIYTYNVLLNTLCKEERIQEALTLFGTMTEKGIKPDVFTFNSLISASCKSGNWDEGVRLFKNMIDYGVLPDIVTYNAVLDALCKEGRTEEALNLVEEMVRRGTAYFYLMSYGFIFVDSMRYFKWWKSRMLVRFGANQVAT